MDNQNQNNLVSSSGQKTPIIKDGISVIFDGDSYGLFVFQKTEKLVKAIYLLTSLMSDKEPMKERSRTIANDMLGSVLKMSERIWGEEECYKKLLSSISEVSILFDIAEATRMMSKMNKQIINSELQKVGLFHLLMIIFFYYFYLHSKLFRTYLGHFLIYHSQEFLIFGGAA